MIESAETVLPLPELAHQGHGLTLADAEGDALDRAVGGAAGAKLDG